MGRLVEYCVGQAICVQIQAPVVHVRVFYLATPQQDADGVFLQSTANAVWEPTVSVAATSDTPLLSTPACQPPYANLRITN